MADALPQVLPVSNVIQFPKPVELEPLLLKVKSKEFEALASLVGTFGSRNQTAVRRYLILGHGFPLLVITISQPW